MNILNTAFLLTLAIMECVGLIRLDSFISQSNCFFLLLLNGRLFFLNFTNPSESRIFLRNAKCSTSLYSSDLIMSDKIQKCNPFSAHSQPVFPIYKILGGCQSSPVVASSQV